MKKIYIVFLLFAMVALSACYDDKGNYDYKDINELEISLEEKAGESARHVILGEVLEIKPKFNLEIDEKSTRYSFEWFVNDKTRPEWNQRNFSWEVDTLIKRGDVILEVTDHKYDVKYMKSIALFVSGIYDNNEGGSWLILSDNGGKSQLSYFSNLEYDDDAAEFKRVDFIHDVYSLVNDGELGRGPIAMQVHFREGVDWKDEIIGNVCVFQESGAVDLSGESFAKEIDLVKAFDGGVYPDGVTAVYPGTFMDMLDVLMDQRGRLYSRLKASSEVYNSEYFLHTPLCFGKETEPLEQCQVARGFYRANRTGYALVYDGKNKRMLYINNPDSYDGIVGAGRITALPACGNNDKEEEIIPLNNMSGYELLSMKMYGPGYPNYGFLLVLREESTDKVFAQIVIMKGSGGNPVIEEVKKYELTGLPAVPTCTTLPLSRPEYAFFSVGREVYYFDLNNPKEPVKLYKSFNAEITAMSAEAEYLDHLAVGLENGEFYVLNIAGAKNLPEEKRVLYPTESVYPEGKKVGRIVDIQYKQQDHWNY